jgi:hypothetical protein
LTCIDVITVIGTAGFSPDPPPESILSIVDNIGVGAGKESGLKRSALLAAAAFVVAAILVASATLSRCTRRHQNAPEIEVLSPSQPADDAAVALLRGIPLYRSFVGEKALRSGRVGDDGILSVEIDLRAILEPRLAAMGFPGGSEWFPRTATGTINPGQGETWSFAGPAAALDLLDRAPAASAATAALAAIPGAPSSLVSIRLLPKRLADPNLGGSALASWRDRANFAERLLGRPVRSELAEDLAGPAVFALYEGDDDTQAEGILAVELRRSDRLSGLVDMLFGLGALTERAAVVRYRGVSTGSFVPKSGGAGIALAVDGPILLVASSRARLESAIDARRDGSVRGGNTAVTTALDASWSAVTTSAFVRHGWARLTRTADEPTEGTIATMSASLRPEGVSGWRLDGTGPAPAITADPILPFFRNALGGRQR